MRPISQAYGLEWVTHSTSNTMVTSCAIVFFIFQLPALIKAPLPQRYVQGYEGETTLSKILALFGRHWWSINDYYYDYHYAVPGLQTPKPPTVQRTLETGEVNDTGAFQADPILKHDEKIPSLAAATTPLPPFLHPLLRNKRETNGISSPSVPLPPYIHPILRCKRGTDDEDCPAVFIPSRTSQPGASATQTEEEHDEEECYYHKLRKTSHETEERPAVSQVKECEGELRRSVFNVYREINNSNHFQDEALRCLQYRTFYSIVHYWFKFEKWTIWRKIYYDIF